MKRRPSSIFLAASMLLSSSAFAWGPAGHRLVNRVAIELMNSDLAPLFQNNSANLQRLANVPDAIWKQPATKERERFTHFFQWNIYKSSSLASLMPISLTRAAYLTGETYLIENGTSVWRADQLYKMLVNAIRSQDWVGALQLAGVMGHYMGDMSQPMHITSDYDGQSINRRGIHAYFESILIDRQEATELHDRVWRAANSRTSNHRDEQSEVLTFSTPSSGIVDVAFLESKRSLTYLQSILNQFNTTNAIDDTALATMAVRSLAEGAIALKTVWDRAANEANSSRNIPSNRMTVADPAWVPVEIVPTEQ